MRKDVLDSFSKVFPRLLFVLPWLLLLFLFRCQWWWKIIMANLKVKDHPLLPPEHDKNF